MTLDQVIQDLNLGKVVRISRWGDGELQCAFQRYRIPHNCDGAPYHKDLGRELHKILSARSDYIHLVGGLALRGFRGRLKSLGFQWSGTANLFVNAVIDGQILKLWPLVDSPESLVVLNHRLQNGLGQASKFFVGDDAWKQRGDILAAVAKLQPARVWIAAGPTSNWVVDQVADRSAIDLGSALDGVLGRYNRSWQRKQGARLNRAYKGMR